MLEFTTIDNAGHAWSVTIAPGNDCEALALADMDAIRAAIVAGDTCGKRAVAVRGLFSPVYCPRDVTWTASAV